ncbi:alkaline phosphatase family protein [Rhodohalobacter sulfatireducens]|uniref:Alkaline phosphatase family protein n=1 Tax=Rhodohalobacter sulfatireducens TaxID=2911366 RepID=A0ABS9K8R7_9BACT|nr:alkaline phosphatase family protein [Rhodohalobacter sulfatireducens]MCG2587231.1 alkaline phosphatase family protein [Rhodohalobacter sulfatireducens]
MAVCFLFVDGVGIGPKTEFNPLASSDLKSFSYFTGETGLYDGCEERDVGSILFKKIDANLEVEGLPQSGTGQTSLFTGENASKVVGRHFGPFPHSEIKPLLKKKSLFHKVIEMGLKPHFLNAYPDLFFEKSQKRNRWSCTTLMARSAGVKLNRLEDVVEGRAVTAEIIQSAWRSKLRLDVPEIEPEEASVRMLKALGQYDLVLFEYYLTDKAGHEQDPEIANRFLSVLDRFITEIIENLDENDTLVLSSDHGNLEDLSIKTHTRNPVPLFVKGNTKPFRNAESILDVTPGILEVLED